MASNDGFQESPVSLREIHWRPKFPSDGWSDQSQTSARSQISGSTSIIYFNLILKQSFPYKKMIQILPPEKKTLHGSQTKELPINWAMSPFSPSFYTKWPSFFVGDAGFRLIQPLRPQSRLVTVGIDNKYDWEKQWSTWNQNQKNDLYICI